MQIAAMGQGISKLIFPKRLKILVLPGSFSNDAVWNYLTEEAPNFLVQQMGTDLGWSAAIGDLVDFRICIPSVTHESSAFAAGSKEMDTYFHEATEGPKNLLDVMDVPEHDTFDWWNVAIDAMPIEDRQLPVGTSLPDEIIDSALRKIRDFVTSKGPFDGVLGFSQGAALAQLLLMGAKEQLPDFQYAQQFRFAVIISAFELPPFPQFKGMYPPREPLDVPVYSIAGVKDYARAACERVAKDGFGQHGLSELHSGGHTVAFTPSADFRYFLQEQLRTLYPEDVSAGSSFCCRRKAAESKAD